MIIEHTEICTHTSAKIDLSKTRKEAGEVMAEAYCKKYNKRKTQKVLDYFEHDAGLYHRVRRLIEDIETTEFGKVVTVFHELYQYFSEDWNAALVCGLLVKAKRREGNYTHTPFVFNSPLAHQIRSMDLTELSRYYRTQQEEKPIQKETKVARQVWEQPALFL